MRLLLILLAVLSLAPAAGARLLSESFPFQGGVREFLLYVPDTLAASPGTHPLVIVLHGGGGTAAEVRRATRHGFETLADRAGFLVLYPQAEGRIWDTGEGAVSAGLKSRRDDLGFLKALISATAQRYPVDRTRIFATGISRGGHAAYMLACRAPGLIRAIAPVAMTLPRGLERDCAKGPPVGLLLIQGTADPLVPYGGGQVTVLGRRRDAVMSAEATFELFSKRNRCGTQTLLSRVGAVDRLMREGCTVPTRLDRVNGGGHSWPGGRSALPRITGATNADISAPAEIWAFFSRFPPGP